MVPGVFGPTQGEKATLQVIRILNDSLGLIFAGPCVNILKARCINCTFSQMEQSLHGYLVLECT